MKIFLSWSGEISREFAEALKQWLPSIIQSVRPWVSPVDIAPGTRWNDEIRRELDNSGYAIACVTPENQDAPWLHFEAGAVARTVEGQHGSGRVVPLLLGLSPGQLNGPWRQFQAKEANRAGLLHVVESINSLLLDAAVDVAILRTTFDRFWSDMEVTIERLNQDLGKTPQPRPVRATDDMLEEVLETVRSISRSLARSNSLADNSPDASVMLDVMQTVAKYGYEIGVMGGYGDMLTVHIRDAGRAEMDHLHAMLLQNSERFDANVVFADSAGRAHFSIDPDGPYPVDLSAIKRRVGRLHSDRSRISSSSEPDSSAPESS